MINSFSRGLAYNVFSKNLRNTSSKVGTGTPAVCPLRPTNTQPTAPKDTQNLPQQRIHRFLHPLLKIHE